MRCSSERGRGSVERRVICSLRAPLPYERRNPLSLHGPAFVCIVAPSVLGWLIHGHRDGIGLVSRLRPLARSLFALARLTNGRHWFNGVGYDARSAHGRRFAALSQWRDRATGRRNGGRLMRSLIRLVHGWIVLNRRTPGSAAAAICLVLAAGLSGAQTPASADHGGPHYAPDGWFGTFTWSGVWDIEDTDPHGMRGRARRSTPGRR